MIMKRLQPVKTQEEDAGYPTVAEALSRRDFIKTALTGATALGGLLVAPSVVWSAVRTKTKRKLYRATVTLKLAYPFWNCGCEAYQVVAVTPSKRLASFLVNKKESKGIQAEVRKVLGAHGCHDLADLKRLKKFHQRLGNALAAYYKKRTKRRIKAPRTRIQLRRLPPRPMVRGRIRIPTRP